MSRSVTLHNDPGDPSDVAAQQEQHAEYEMDLQGSGRTRSWDGPQKLADAVLTQAFTDLNNLVDTKDDNLQRYWKTARAFLLGQTPEGTLARATYCDTLNLDPAFIERNARELLELLDAPEVDEKPHANEKPRGSKQVA